MSYDTHKNWLYKIIGRNLYLYQLADGSTVDVLGGYKIKLPQDYRGSKLIYPSEAISDGLRIEYTSLDGIFCTTDPNELGDGDALAGITEDTGVDEDSHLNFDRILSLAIVDYVRAMYHERTGDIKMKEYYMREFWKKAGDAQSNKRKINMVMANNTFAVK